MYAIQFKLMVLPTTAKKEWHETALDYFFKHIQMKQKNNDTKFIYKVQFLSKGKQVWMVNAAIPATYINTVLRRWSVR